MICVCCVCKKVYGQKPPLENQDETHGFCPDCYQKEIKKIENHHSTHIMDDIDRNFAQIFVGGDNG